MDKLNSLSTGEKLVAGGGVLIFIASFFKWFKVDFDLEGLPGFFSSSGGTSGWGAPGSIWSVLAILVSVILAAIVLARLANVNLPALPPNLTWGRIIAGGAAAVVILMLLKAWRISAFDCKGLNGCSGGFDIGFFIAVIAAVAIAAGGYLLYAEEKSGVRRV